MTEETVKRGPGRPRKNPAVQHEPKRPKMRAAPNWETFEPSSEDTPDRFHISPDLIPEGYALQWVTDSVYGQPMGQHRMIFEKGGWTPVHQDDFDGQFDGMFMKRGDYTKEINLDGMVLMARPKQLHDAAKRRDMIAAREQISIKEAALRGGDIPTTLDSRHPSAVGSNKISKSYERIDIPKD